MHRFRALTPLLLAGLCAACAGGPPEWVTQPAVEGGLAATDCVRDSGKLSLDRQVALSKARAGLATQFGQRARAMDAAWATIRPPAEDSAVPGASTPFALAARPVAEQLLSAAEPERVEYVEVEDSRQLCAMVTVPAEGMRPLFDRLVQATGEKPDEAATATLFAAFLGAARPAE